MASALWLVGGSGMVGEHLAALLVERHPEWPLVIVGRDLGKAQRLATRLPGARARALDIASDPLDFIGVERPALVVALANDPGDRLLTACVAQGVPYLDITRWTERLQAAVTGLATQPEPSAPVVFASGWMASVAATLARGLVADLSSAEVYLDILYAMADKAGPNSVEYMDRLQQPFTVYEAGRQVQKWPFSDPRRVTFSGLRPLSTYRFDAPEQATLAEARPGLSVSTRLAFDSLAATQLLRGLVRSGIWKAISGQRFTPLRRSLLYNPGQGGAHRIAIEVTGPQVDGARVQRRLEIIAPQGQTYLTALGALIQVERILGVAGHQAAAAGGQFAELVTDPVLAQRTLTALGVQVHGHYPEDEAA